MGGAFSSMHGRVLCHTTERLDRVEKAITEVFGDCELDRRHTVGHHGNEIVVIETRASSDDRPMALFRRLASEELRMLDETLEKRTDDSCNLFLRIDKQSAFLGELRLAENDDAVAVRMKVRAFPAKKASAVKLVSELLRELAGQDPAPSAERDSFK